MKLTLAQVKASTLPAAVNMPSCDSRFLSLVNEAVQRLVMRPSAWYDMHYRYQITATDGLVTWPREIASVSTIAKCCQPIVARDMWFEFLETGFGLRETCGDDPACGCWDEALDRGVSPLFTDMSGSYKLKLYCDLAADANDIVIVKGYDANGNWLRTLYSGSYIDGERIAASVAGMQSSNTFSSVTEIVKPVSEGAFRLYEYNPTDASQSLIGTYQWDETVPRYRRTYIGGICGDDDTAQINVIAKREFIQVRNDNDVLMVGNLPAIKAMCFAILKEDKNDQAAALVDEARAFRLMDEEAQHYLGTGVRIPIRMQSETWGAGGI
jgi:hypothetical protein